MSLATPSYLDILMEYNKNIQDQQCHLHKLKQEKRLIATGRFLSAIAGFSVSWYFRTASGIFIFALIFFTAIFVWLLFRDADKTDEINNGERLIRVNQHEIDAIRQTLKGYEDGREYSEPAHAYASDLDLFGDASLFQWISRCHAEQSRDLLAKYLKTSQPATLVKEKQAAVKELSEKQGVCQQFQSTAMVNPLTRKTEIKLKQWMASPSIGYRSPIWQWIQNIYPVLPLGLVSIYILDIISANDFLLFLAVLYIFQILVFRKIAAEFDILLKIEQEMETLYKQIFLIERENFTSQFLHTLQTRLTPADFSSAAASIKNLNFILKRIGWRLNLIVNAVLQLFFIWDLRLILLLNDWKRKNQRYLHQWFDTIAEMEVAVSLASLVHNEPGWCFPEVDENYFHFDAYEIGHPLIPEEKRVVNDFFMEGRGKIALVTGSNMAGKSTFLRTLGINTILAMMGAPVCAKQMKLSSLKLITSMRVADNLSENASTFYAELKKLQSIIESVNRHEQLLILLDEVLRGTNSTDRHKGTRALVRQLQQTGAVAVLATHDTDLAHSESTDKAVANYHFESKIHNDELYFDYKIRTGICESLNATTLMKKIGIHFED